MQDQQSTFVWQDLTIEVLLSFPVYLRSYKLVYGYEMAHFEIESLGREPLPVSETGYRSVFLRPEEIEAEGGLVAYARALLDFEARSPAWLAHKIATRQYSLFE